MNCKEKAEDLVNKCTLFSGGLKALSDGAKRHAKQCAIICVEEIINSQWALSPFSEKGTPWTLYWQSVKTEIEKL